MKVRHGVLFSAIAVLLSVPGLTSAVLAADHPPLERDFFGTVVSVEDGFVLVQTDEGVVEVPVSDSTHVRSRVNPEGNVADLVAGDSIALSLTDGTAGLVADRILVIPGKTSIRHIPGVVIGLSDSEVIIRPVGAAGAISLGRPPDDDVQFHGGATGLTEGSTIILVAESSPQTGDLLLDEVQLHVTQTAEAVDLPENEPSASAGDAIVRGSFQRIDGEGRWVIDGTPVTVNAATTVTGAVVVGQPLSIEAMLTADGSLVARHVEPVDAASEASERTLFLGAFQGVDVDGRWIVAGTPIQVDSSSDTDGLPPLGELVKVNAVLTTGGVLVVREIESRPTGTGQRVTGAEVNGTFQGIASDGKWNVGGTVVTISPETPAFGCACRGPKGKGWCGCR